MSATEIFAFYANGDAEFYDEVKNAWRSAPIIWRRLEEKYLPPYIPDYVTYCKWYKEEMPYDEICERLEYKPSRFPDFSTDKSGFKEICNLVNNDNVSTNDKIILYSTFDYSLVKKQDFQRIIRAFYSFDVESSLPEQAAIFEEMSKDKNIIAAGWNQTNVNCDTWGNSFGQDKPYNCLIEDCIQDHKHYWIFDEIK